MRCRWVRRATRLHAFVCHILPQPPSDGRWGGVSLPCVGDAEHELSVMKSAATALVAECDRPREVRQGGCEWSPTENVVRRPDLEAHKLPTVSIVIAGQLIA